ncbi:hypothetical protein PHISP_08729, partial [Aspergillus sp. HF37]
GQDDQPDRPRTAPRADPGAVADPDGHAPHGADLGDALRDDPAHVALQGGRDHRHPRRPRIRLCRRDAAGRGDGGRALQ